MTYSRNSPASFSAPDFIITTARSADEARADYATGFNEIGTISLHAASENPQDIEQLVAQKANEQSASWYRIVCIQQNTGLSGWRVQAIIYA